MEKYFAELITLLGRPIGEPFNSVTLEKLRGRVPGGLVGCWEKHGIGTVLDGFFQFVDPTEYAGVCETIFEGDPEIDPERSHIVGLSAFGNLLVWNEDYNLLRIDLVNLRASGPEITKKNGFLDGDLAIIAGLAVVNRDSFDERDSDGEGLFKSAKQKLGQLDLNQIYGFVPILALGGNRSVEHLKIVSAPEHLLILAQSGPISLMDMSTPYGQKIRDIGCKA